MSGTLTARIGAAREAGDPNAMAEAIPYARFLDITAALDGDDLVACMNFNQRIIGNPLLPAIHGGTIGGLLETTAILKLLWMQETVRIPKTITITVDYLRSAGPKDTYARAKRDQAGRPRRQREGLRLAGRSGPAGRRRQRQLHAVARLSRCRPLSTVSQYLRLAGPSSFETAISRRPFGPPQWPPQDEGNGRVSSFFSSS